MMQELTVQVGALVGTSVLLYFVTAPTKRVLNSVSQQDRKRQHHRRPKTKRGRYNKKKKNNKETDIDNGETGPSKCVNDGSKDYDYNDDVYHTDDNDTDSENDDIVDNDDDDDDHHHYYEQILIEQERRKHLRGGLQYSAFHRKRFDFMISSQLSSLSSTSSKSSRSSSTRSVLTNSNTCEMQDKLQQQQQQQQEESGDPIVNKTT